MNKTKKIIGLLTLSLASVALASCKKKEKEEYDEQGRLKISLRNLYFNQWDGIDSYTEYIEDKFNVSITPTNYSWASWDEQVMGPANANNLTDVFHYSLDSYNYENSYKYWADGGVIKALPDDMSRWPLLSAAINKCTNIESIKIDGKLYCIPIIKNVDSADITYSPFTYVYRRDWAKRLDVYKPNDEYTWQEFIALLDAFYIDCSAKNGYAAIADVEWGYPSVTNFYKQYPHIFALDNSGKVVNNYTTNEYIQGLELAKEWSSGARKYYGISQYEQNDGDVNEKYVGNRIGVFYENLSLANYTTLRDNLMKTNTSFTKAQLDDATALLKVKGPDGKYALEGTENWFSATFFNGDMSDEKMNKILDIMEWTLGEEGTKMAAYGIEGYDYNIVGGEVVLSEDGWDVDKNGRYVAKNNGAKYLRYMVTLGYDMNEYDPLVDKDALTILDNWYETMDNAKNNNLLRVIAEPTGVDWMYTPSKAKYAGDLLEKANDNAMQYCYAKTGFNTTAEYISKFNTTGWSSTLNELNTLLGK